MANNGTTNIRNLDVQADTHTLLSEHGNVHNWKITSKATENITRTTNADFWKTLESQKSYHLAISQLWMNTLMQTIRIPWKNSILFTLNGNFCEGFGKGKKID